MFEYVLEGDTVYIESISRQRRDCIIFGVNVVLYRIFGLIESTRILCFQDACTSSQYLAYYAN